MLMSKHELRTLCIVHGISQCHVSANSDIMGKNAEFRLPGWLTNHP